MHFKPFTQLIFIRPKSTELTLLKSDQRDSRSFWTVYLIYRFFVNSYTCSEKHISLSLTQLISIITQNKALNLLRSNVKEYPCSSDFGQCNDLAYSPIGRATSFQSNITAAMAQWVRALAPQAKGWVFEFQPRQT